MKDIAKSQLTWKNSIQPILPAYASQMGKVKEYIQLDESKVYLHPIKTTKFTEPAANHKFTFYHQQMWLLEMQND